jgi:hypothetical protein
VGEIILGYSDLLLHEALQEKAKEYEEQGRAFPDYEIIRYRDDYRIFCSNKDVLEEISYVLQQVLERLNFRMNSQKTKISESIVTDAVKADKLAYIYNTPIYNNKGVDFDSFEKHLLYILMFSRQYPDSGSVRTMLSDIDKRIEEWLKPFEDKNRSMTDNCKTIVLGEESQSNKSDSIISKLKTYKRAKYIPGPFCRMHTDCS